MSRAGRRSVIIDQLAGFSSPKYPVLSVYLDRDDNPASVGARLTELLKPFKERLGELDHAAAMSLRSDLERVAALRERLETDPAPSVAVFACEGESLFAYEPLVRRTGDQAMVGPKPYIRPMRAAHDDSRIAVAVVDRRTATLYTMQAGRAELRASIVDTEELKPNYGGWHGYEERNARAHADEVTRRHFRQTAEAIFSLHQSDPVDRLVVGGHQMDVDEFVSTLHPYLKHLHAGTFTCDPRTLTESGVADHAGPIEAAARRRDEDAIVEDLLAKEASGGLATLGTSRVIAAANVRAIETLVVAGPFRRPGTVCDGCGWLSRTDDECPACGDRTRHTEDVVAEVIEAAVRDGGTAHQVTVASRLDRDGVGARLRFPIPPGL